MERPAPSPERERRIGGLQLVVALAAAMWIFEIADTVANHSLDKYGIEPRDPDGLVGVVAAPFLHADFAHLIGNSVPFLVMGFVIALGGAVRVAAVTAIVAAISGAGTWLIGPDNSIHIGASGVVFGYATYLISRGIFNRSALEILVGVIVGAVWGSALLAGIEPQEAISWQGHLFGAIGGVVAARTLAKSRERPAAQPA